MVGLSVAVVVFGAVALPAPLAAGADQISGTRSQIEALQQQVVASAGRIHTLTLAFQQSNTEAGVLAQQVASDEADVTRLRSQAAATAGALRADAIISYTGGAGSTVSGPAGSDDPAVRAEYLEVAAGNLSDTVDLYKTEQQEVASAEATLSSELRASEAAARATAQARQVALGQAGAVQARLDSLQAQLSQLEATRAAAQAAEAEAAAAARAARPVTQGLPVNGGLVAAVRSAVSPGGNAGGVWLQLRECESGDNYREDSGNGFYGAYQFSQQTWTNLGYSGRPDLEPPAMQDQAAQKLQSESGWGQWPACSAALGLS